jgi:hypothetical protein
MIIFKREKKEGDEKFTPPEIGKRQEEAEAPAGFPGSNTREEVIEALLF